MNTTVRHWLTVILGVTTLTAAPAAVELVATHWWAVLAGLVVAAGMFTALVERELT